MFSQEMQIIMGVVVIALLVTIAWALWRRTARQSLTALLLIVGVILVFSGGVPVVWWQLTERIKSSVAQPIAIRDHRISSENTSKIDQYLRLETEIDVVAPKLPQERLEEIAHAYLRTRLDTRRTDRPDLAAVQLQDGGSRPLLYFYAYKKSLDAEELQPWLRPAPTETTTGAHLAEPSLGELGDYRTVAIFVQSSTKWAHLSEVLGPDKLPQAWQALDESLYDYVILYGESPQLVLLFALLDEEFLQQYQAAGGKPEELGLLINSEIPTPSLLILAQALQESVLRLGDLAFAQTSGAGTRRFAVRELAVRENAVDSWRQPWLRLAGNFPDFPNLLAQLRPGVRVIGLLRFPEGLDPYQAFQIYYGDRWASFRRKI